MYFKIIIIFFTLITFSCGQISNQSKNQGHFENSSEQANIPFAYNQKAVPEYVPISKVFFTELTFSAFASEVLIKTLIDSGVEEVIIGVTKESDMNVYLPKYRNLASILGPDISKVSFLFIKSNSINLSLWARDFAPIPAKSINNELVLLDFNYLPGRFSDNAAAQELQKHLGVKRVSIPIYSEGGNFMINDDGHCMLASNIIKFNSRKQIPEDQILDEIQIKKLLDVYAGCKTTTIFPNMPHEGTGHIDLWAKFLTNELILVNEMQDKTINLISNIKQKQMALDIKKYLDERAVEISRLGFKVIRIPMPAPGLTDAAPIMRSYTNSLLVNGKVIQTQYKINRYRSMVRPYIDETLLLDYEKQVVEAYSQAGFETIFIDSDELITFLGAIHCITMQYPK